MYYIIINTKCHCTIREKSVLSNIDLHKNETFLDVGANVGNYTLRVAHKYKDNEVRIISIEANPETYRALCRNIDCNNFKNVKTICKAVTDHKGSVAMYDQIDSKSISLVIILDYPLHSKELSKAAHKFIKFTGNWLI